MDSKIKKYCPNCSQLYILQSFSKPQQKFNLPLFLSCGHSMCEKCITNIVKFGEPIECKVCHNDTQITASAVTSLTQNKLKIYQFFPINTFLVGELALDILENSGTIVKKSDEDHYIDLKMLLTDNNKEQGKCVECHKPTSKMCQQCDNILCDFCFKKSHNNFVIFKNHVLKTIETPLEANNCKTHNKPLDYYCKDCSKALCMDCLMVGNEKSCKNHNVVSMQEVNEDIMQDLGNISPKINEIFKRLTKSAVDVGNLLHHIENETESESELTKLIPNLEQSFSKLCYVIQKHKKEIFDIIIKFKNSEKYSLQTAKDNIADSLKKIHKVVKMIEMTTDANILKQINLSQLLEMAKQVAETPWFLKKDDEIKDNLKLTVNEDLCTLVSDYVHLEGNSNFVYKLCCTSELGNDVEIPPPPTGLVYPPELPKDVRQLKNPKPEVDKDNQKGQAFHKFVPKYRSKSGSMASLNSCDSGDSFNRSFVSGETRQKPMIQPVSPFSESHYPKHLQEGTQELIYISHIIDPHNFYVQRACHQGIVKEMMNEFRNAISLPKPSINHVAEGKIYLAFHKADNIWQRCKIVNVDRRDVNKPVFRVFCIDFGSTEIVTIDKLRLLPPARVQSPYPLAINCCLANCVPKVCAWTNDDAYLIQNIVDNKQAVMHIRNIRSTSNHNTMQIECDITTFEHGVSIAHALVFHERAKMPNPGLPYIMPIGLREKPKIYMSNDCFKPKTVEAVYITHIVSPDNFFVRKAHHQNAYEKLCEDMEQEYSLNVQTGTIYLPEVGMVCAANVEKYRQDNGSHVWVRGVIREVLGRARVTVLLPDTGEQLLLHYSALRYIHHNFTTLNALATECHLAGVTPLKKKWSTESVVLLRKFENRLLELHVDENRNRGSLSVTLYDKTDAEKVVCVNNEMIKHKFAVSFGIFHFNKNTADEVITNKYPPPVVVEDRVRPKAKRNIVLKKQTRKKVNDEDLEVKDKGPLRLEAKILNYQSPSLIYLSLVHQQKTFNELFENIQKHYGRITIEGERKWQANDRCCTLCIQSQTWRRAVILELENGKAKVFYSDFACIETVPVSQLRELTPEFASIGDAAIKCHLCGVIPAVGEEWPSLTKEYLKELLDAYKRIFITKLGNFKNKSMPIEIWVYHTIQGGALEPNKSEWRCLNKRIIEQGLGIPDKSHEAINPDANPVADDEMLSFLNITGSVHDWLLLDPMPMKPLEAKPAFDSNSNSSNLEEFDDNDKIVEKPHGSNVMFISDWLPPEPLPNKEFTGIPTYIDNDGIIYLHDISQQDTLDLIRKALDIRFKDPDPKAKYAKWTVGEPCIALFFLDNRFYRGKVVEVNDEASTCLIHYIDYGNEEQCSFTNLRKTIALHQIPTQATKCILNRIKPKEKQWDRQTLDYIHKSIVEKQCYVKVAGDPIGDIIPIDLKYDRLWINDHLVEFEMAVYCDGSKAIVRKFAPENVKNVTSENLTIESDSGPDFIVEEDLESASPLSTSHDSLDIKDMKGIPWNEMLEEDNESLEGNYSYITYPKYTKDDFKCNISVLNDPYTLQLNIHDTSTEKVYEEIFKAIQNDGVDMPPLNGIFENKACIALYPEDGLWYRAVILQYSESKGKVKVRYVDFGNIEIIPFSDVREIIEEWVTLPPLTVSAKLYGIKLNSNIDKKAVIEEYDNILLDKGSFDVRVIKYEDSLPFVELRNENDELINDILIKSGLFSADVPDN